MQDKPTLYLESTIPSYLAARPSRDLIVAAHQQITHEWWEYARPNFEIYISEAVFAEISAGDPEAASRRLSFVENFPVLALNHEIETLAGEYQHKLGLPLKARIDALHIACAVIYELEYLLTWNCTHIANGVMIKRLQNINTTINRITPIIVTPEELLLLPEGG